MAYSLKMPKEQFWIARELEESTYVTFSDEDEKLIMKLLSESEWFDHYLARKFPQTKRVSNFK